ncbi:MAG: hypothetical protein LBE48_05755 [Methanomassiliicoccaceae archaeon]|jgi:hypothetical protein|nr:hypothetical protein [Methanomassiliicoccaceae archaeon]
MDDNNDKKNKKNDDRKISDMDTDEILKYLAKKEKKKVEELLTQIPLKVDIGPQKEKAEDAFRSIISLFFNPEIQKHFVKAGIEILSGVEEAIKNMPMPDFVKETMNKASETKDEMKKDFCDSNPDCKVKKDKKMKKIDVEG